VTSLPTTAVSAEPITTAPPPTSTPEATATPPAGRFPAEALAGTLGILVVLGYGTLYWLGLRSVERYTAGFVITRCPVCSRGSLTVETRQERFFGIPRPRHTARCTHCRSVLREVSSRRWRYAVDPMENPALYRRYNGQVVDEPTLVQLAARPDHPPPAPSSPPTFVDEDDQ